MSADPNEINDDVFRAMVQRQGFSAEEEQAVDQKLPGFNVIRPNPSRTRLLELLDICFEGIDIESSSTLELEACQERFLEGAYEELNLARETGLRIIDARSIIDLDRFYERHGVIFLDKATEVFGAFCSITVGPWLDISDDFGESEAVRAPIEFPGALIGFHDPLVIMRNGLTHQFHGHRFVALNHGEPEIHIAPQMPNSAA